MRRCTRRWGGNYQSLINLALREHVNRSGEPLEETLRRILREESHQEIARLAGVRRKAATKGKAPRKKPANRQRLSPQYP